MTMWIFGQTIKKHLLTTDRASFATIAQVGYAY